MPATLKKARNQDNAFIFKTFGRGAERDCMDGYGIKLDFRYACGLLMQAQAQMV